MVGFLVRKSLQFRWILSAVILALWILSAIPFFKFFGVSDNSLPVWFEDNDPAYLLYQKYIQTFGNDRFVIIGFEFGDAFSPDALRLVFNVTEDLRQIPDVERVTSLTHAELIESVGDEIRIAPLIEEIPNNPEMSEALRRKALSEPDFVGNLVTKDSRVATLIAHVNTPNSTEASARLKQEIISVIARHNSLDIPYHLSGSPITDEAFDRLVVRDQKIFMPAIVVVVVMLILLFFRSALLALIPTLLQVIVLFWVLAVYLMMGFKMNVTAGMVVPIMIAVCIADSVHMMLEYYRERSHGQDKKSALVASASHLWRPCFFTAATTLAGFISFQSSSIPPINHLGTLTAIGVAIAFVLTIFFVPVILSFLPEPKREVALHIDRNLIQRFLKFTSHLNEHYTPLVLLVFAVLSGLSLIGMSRLTIETNFTEYFPKKEKVRQDINFFNKHLSGVVSYEVVLEGNQNPQPLAKMPEVLKAVDLFQQTTLQNPATRQPVSVVNYVKRLNQAFHEGDSSFYEIPDTREAIAQLLLLADSSGDHEIDQYKTSDDQQIRIAFKTVLLSSEKLGAYLDEVRQLAQKIFSPLGVKANLTGYGPLWVWLDNNILKSQILSFLIAFIVVSLMMMMVLKSVKVGIISMVPNVLPIMITMGLMGFVGINLNVSTVMIAAVTVGITVDDTIHYLTRFQAILKREKDYLTAMRLTNETIGTAIIFTSCILIGGFGIMCLGSFVPSITFGGMAALTLFLSIFCEVFLTPILVMKLKPFKI